MRFSGAGAWASRRSASTFPWEPVPVRGRPSILIGTDYGWRKQFTATGLNTHAVFAELAAAWPDKDWDLVLNPGTPVSITLTAAEVREFART